jgi:hypothetical protein
MGGIGFGVDTKTAKASSISIPIREVRSQSFDWADGGDHLIRSPILWTNRFIRFLAEELA